MSTPLSVALKIDAIIEVEHDGLHKPKLWERRAKSNEGDDLQLPILHDYFDNL